MGRVVQATFANKKEWAVALITAALLVLALYGPIVAHVGWISDDYDLIERNSGSRIWEAQEKHHYSPFVNLLFFMAAAGYIGAPFFHLLAIGLHIANCFLVYWIGRSPLGLNAPVAAGAMLLFALAPAGSESVIWCCAVPYLLLTAGILSGLGSYLTYLGNPHRANLLGSCLLLGAVQIFLFLIWDWAILFFPLLVAAAFLFPSQRPLREKVFPLHIAMAAWVTAIILKKMFGLTLGYHFNSLDQMFKNLFSSPFAGLLPQLSKSFYSSLGGIVGSLGLIAFFIFMALRERIAALFLLFFVLCQFPHVLMGHPQGRYHYVSMFALVYLIAVAAARYIRDGRLRAALLLLAALFYFRATESRVAQWADASAEAVRLREQVVAASVGVKEPLVVVNLPQMYGKEGIWRPYLWRCGLGSFNTPLVRVDTPASGNPESSLVPVLDRRCIASAYAGHLIYEVVRGGEGEGYKLVRFVE